MTPEAANLRTSTSIASTWKPFANENISSRSFVSNYYRVTSHLGLLITVPNLRSTALSVCRPPPSLARIYDLLTIPGWKAR